MRLISLELTNIRSYANEKIEFPTGIILLAGDIGCGKSTLLLAIEFALFGLRRGEGISLLRHGTQEGSITLTFAVRGQEYSITRALKKTSTGVGQDAGSITCDGSTTDMTAVELKTKVLEILNYPESLLSKSNSLVFRYTVYTPQEEMKHILFEKSEDRLDTFRKLFAIDKYKTIRENATLLARELKNTSERLLGKSEGIEETKTQRKELDAKLVALLQEKDTCAKNVIAAKEVVARCEKQLQEQEAKCKAVQEQKNTLQLYRQEYAQLLQVCKRLEEEIAHAKKELFALQDVSSDSIQKKETVAKKLAEILAAKNSLQKVLQENSANQAKLEYMLEDAIKRAKEITTLEDCPTCKQEVTSAHKEHITTQATQKQEKVSARKQTIDAAIAQAKEKFRSLEAQEQELRSEQERLVSLVAKVEYKEKLTTLLVQKEQELATQKEVLATKETQGNELEAKIVDTSQDDERLRRYKEEVLVAQKNAQEEHIRAARVEESITFATKQQEELTKTLEEKERALMQAKEYVHEQEWLTKEFTTTMFTIEKHILATLYHQFNDMFKKWFNTLIEDDTLSVRLDSDFTPLVVQNGYETTIVALSGGEKTAVALAYRLALNSVINEALQNLNTHNLLILDEPTDGFSTEQLDRVQEVLFELGLEQILIVSHEQKMESFVDQVIRIVKNDHESKVLM